MAPLLILALIVLVAGLWGHLETWRLRIVHTDHRSESVPKAFEGYRIALIGGLHLRRFGPWTRRVQKEILNLDPDVVLIAGNVKPSHRAVNGKIHQLLEKFVDPLKPPDGILAVRGYRDRKGFWEELPPDSKIQLLTNSFLRVERQGEGLNFLGVQTAHASHLDRGINQIREATSKVGDGGFRVLVGQSADLLRAAQGQPVDLILAVDNLHYQIRIPGVGVPRRDTKVPIRWERGWIFEGGLPLYLSPGLGVRWLRFRFFLRPEMTCITLRRGAPG